MEILLQNASMEDCSCIHAMQVASFRALLEKYCDLNTNPGAEPLSRVIERMNQPFTDYYLILKESITIGAIRIIKCANTICRISPIFILPEHQGYGFAQKAMLCVEELYPHVKLWQLDTILQEEKLCHLYEKLGYQRTGKTETIQPGMDIVYYEKHK
ncbi:MAG TPA: GNAT family N-acetyltransferase [Clostridia bacterium]|nr:GNAT family N-acetyltransferase [Clostridia bacterium]